jgi:hypothetical protein
LPEGPITAGGSNKTAVTYYNGDETTLGFTEGTTINQLDLCRARFVASPVLHTISEKLFKEGNGISWEESDD